MFLKSRGLDPSSTPHSNPEQHPGTSLRMSLISVVPLCSRPLTINERKFVPIVEFMVQEFCWLPRAPSLRIASASLRGSLGRIDIELQSDSLIASAIAPISEAIIISPALAASLVTSPKLSGQIEGATNKSCEA